MSEYRNILDKYVDEKKYCKESEYKDYAEFILQFVKGRCLEIGCGDGAWTPLFRDRCRVLFSLDLSLKRVKRTRKANPQVNFVLCDARYLPFKNEAFDSVVALEVIEHLPNVFEHSRFLQEIKRVLKREGVALISTPNKPIFRFYSRLTKDSDSTHFSELNYFQFREILSRTFSDVKLYGKFGWLSPFYKYRFIRKLHGFLSKFVPFCKGLLAVCKRS